MKMKALIVTEPNLSTIQEIDCPEIANNEMLIKVMAVGICGTDIHIYQGKYLGKYPIIPGHELSGIVYAVGSEVSRFSVGDHVAVEPNICCNNCSYCLSNKQNFCKNWEAIGVTLPGGMAQYVVAPEQAVFSIEGLSFLEGVFIEPLSCVLHGIEQLQVRFGDNVLILGAGPIGILLLQSIILQGASKITQVDKNLNRLELAKKYGASNVLNSTNRVPIDSYDIVIDATGSINIMNNCLQYVQKGGQILFFGVPNKDDRFNFSAFNLFEKGLKIATSYTSVRNSLQAISLLKNKKIVIDSLISHKLPLRDFKVGIELLKNSNEDVRKIILEPWSN